MKEQAERMESDWKSERSALQTRLVEAEQNLANKTKELERKYSDQIEKLEQERVSCDFLVVFQWFEFKFYRAAYSEL